MPHEKVGPMLPSCPRGPSGERGIVLVVTLLFAVSVLGLAVALAYTTTSSLDQRRRLAAKSRAVEAAESGLNHLVAALNGPASSSVVLDGGLAAALTGDEASTRAVRYEVRIEEAGDDRFDNDLDGYVDEPDEQTTYEAVSVGYCDDTFAAIGATVRLKYPAAIASATYFADPLSQTVLNGNAFRISGYDVDGSRVATGFAVPAIGVAGDPQFVRDQIQGEAVDNVEGTGGSPSVQQVPRLELGEMIESGMRAATVVLPGGSSVAPASPGAWGTVDAPAIVYGAGDIHVSGGAAGAGLLIVDGALTISGSFEWWGLVIVRGTVALAGGGSGERITGALVVDKHADLGGQELSFPMSGTVDILFSEQAIALVMRPFARYTIMNWREAPVPPSIPRAWLTKGLISEDSLPVGILPLSAEISLSTEAPLLTVEVEPITLDVPLLSEETTSVTIEVPPLEIPSLLE